MQLGVLHAGVNIHTQKNLEVYINLLFRDLDLDSDIKKLGHSAYKCQ